MLGKNSLIPKKTLPSQSYLRASRAGFSVICLGLLITAVVLLINGGGDVTFLFIGSVYAAWGLAKSHQAKKRNEIAFIQTEVSETAQSEDGSDEDLPLRNKLIAIKKGNNLLSIFRGIGSISTAAFATAGMTNVVMFVGSVTVTCIYIERGIELWQFKIERQLLEKKIAHLQEDQSESVQQIKQRHALKSSMGLMIFSGLGVALIASGVPVGLQYLHDSVRWLNYIAPVSIIAGITSGLVALKLARRKLTLCVKCLNQLSHQEIARPIEQTETDPSYKCIACLLNSEEISRSIRATLAPTATVFSIFSGLVPPDKIKIIGSILITLNFYEVFVNSFVLGKQSKALQRKHDFKP